MSEAFSLRPPGAQDFDFIHGSWVVKHRKLREPLAGSSDWISFGGTMRAEPILRGLGNFDQNVIEFPAGRYEACTLRLFHPGSSQWSLHWIDGRDPKIDPPLFGSFKAGVGTFYGDDHLRDLAIKVRFLWEHSEPGKARWDQAFSPDGGHSWETNWFMEFTRT